MPSSFMVKRSYAHCPLKKRPLALYNEPASAPEQQEPEDLSVKRPRTSSPPPPVVSKSCRDVLQHAEYSFTCNGAFPLSNQPSTCPVEGAPVFHQHPFSRIQPEGANILPSPHAVPLVVPTQQQLVNSPVTTSTPQGYFYNHNQPSQPLQVITPTPMRASPPTSWGRSPPVLPNRAAPKENLPSLAEYYLQLFKATSEAEAKKKETPPPPPLPPTASWSSPPPTYFPLSPQTSPTSSSAAPIQQFYPLPGYPETSALISPVSTCSSTAESDSETEAESPRPASTTPFRGTPTTPAAPENSPKGGSSRYPCDSCGKSYSTQSGLRKHSELHCASLGSRAFACKHCAKAYTSVGALKMHIRTHTLPCKCHVCGKAFSRPWLLQGHIRTHTGEKPFECHQCQRSFADRSNLRAHLQTHERVKKYACQTCKKTFSRMSLLNKHSENACIGGRLPSHTPICAPPSSSVFEPSSPSSGAPCPPPSLLQRA